MSGILGALYLLIAGTADHISTKTKGRLSAAKLQKHFDEQERVRKEGEAKIQRSIDRMLKEDAEQEARDKT